MMHKHNALIMSYMENINVKFIVLYDILTL